MRKYIFFIVVLSFVASQAGFSDDLINSSYQSRSESNSKKSSANVVYSTPPAKKAKPTKKKKPKTKRQPKKESQTKSKLKEESPLPILKPIQTNKSEPAEVVPPKSNEANIPKSTEVVMPKPSQVEKREPNKAYTGIPKEKAEKSRVNKTKPKHDITHFHLFGIGHENTWRIIPGFKFDTLYDSNINREPPHHRNEDIIFSYIPSVDVKRAGTRYDFRTNYEMSFLEFLKNGKQNNFNHVITSRFDYKGNRLQVKLNENFSHISTYASSEQGERRRIMVNDFNPEVIYRLTSKVSISSIYQNYLFSYKDSILKEDSYDTNSIGGRFYYHVTPKLNLYLQGAGFDTDFYNSGKYDSAGYTILVGANGRVTSKLMSNFQTGFKANRYHDSTIQPFYDWIVEGAFQYRMTSKIDVLIMAKRDKEESVYRTDAWYQTNFLNFVLNYKIKPRISMSVESGIRRNAYPRETTEGTLTKKRKDYIFNTGILLKWRPIRNLILSLGYNFQERFSNFGNVLNYVVHALDASVSYQFA